MENNHKEHKLTPSEFYRKIRPEYFSDSIKLYKVQLPKEQFEYILTQISADQKHDSFETLARKLAEIFIAPNLIPQVGPTGGGDGKTDTETYPVSSIISERWFVPEKEYDLNQKWAFAISAKTDWKSKIKEDVKKIIETNRGYTKIYFISNQKISSKQRQDTQDLLSNEFKISINILDGVWIIDKIYSNDLINLVVETLHLSDSYKQEVKIGSNDTDRLKILEDLETKIANPNRYFEYDYQLVEDMLESAILTRMLEKSKDEVIGKFDRALRIAKKINNEQQLLRIYYQRAWTYINWYDDYSNYFHDFNEIEKNVKLQPTIFGIELYFNLLNILKGIVLNQQLHSDKLENYTKEFIDLLDKCVEDNSKPCRSLIAKTYKSFLSISNGMLNNNDISSELTNLKGFFEQGVNYFEYPFEVFKQIIEKFGDLLPNNKEYDNLIDSVAVIYGNRMSALNIGRTFLRRGWQKLENNLNKESIIYFGKAVLKISREDNKEELFSCLIGLSRAYKNIGLVWASNNALITGISIYINKFYNQGKIDKKLLWCLQELLINEIIIGRITNILNWYELYDILSKQVNIEDKSEKTTFLNRIDAYLSVRLINMPYRTWAEVSFLPDIFNADGLVLSEDAVLFMLGYSEKLIDEVLKESEVAKTFDEYYDIVYNHPIKQEFLYKTNLLNSEILEFNSIVLGVKIHIVFKKDTELLILAETILAYIESFFATSLKEILPYKEEIIIELAISEYVDIYKIFIDENNTTIKLCINGLNIKSNNQEIIKKILGELIGYVIEKNFIVKKDLEYIKTLFEDEELHERQYMIYIHRLNLLNILGETPRLLLEDRVKNRTLKEFAMKRINAPKFNDNEKSKSSKEILDKIDISKHNQIKVVSAVDLDLWDKAHWVSFGIFETPNIPFGLLIGFKDGIFGKKIFDNWIKEFGKEDKENIIRISIIKGINKNRPNDYRVHIAKDIKMNKSSVENNMFLVCSRYHEMNPQNSKNLDEIIKRYDSFKKYSIVPAQFDGKTQEIIYWESAILKSNLIIKNAWEIGEHDMDCAVIKKDDNPIIPDNAAENPINELLKKLNAKDIRKQVKREML